MSLLRRARGRALCFFAFSLTLSFATAQTCWYPDGKTISTTDIPCNASAAVSPCCGSDQFCLVGGLCFGGGIVTRGSCSSQSWNNEICAAVCTNVNPSTDVGITPCTDDLNPNGSNDFVCGVNNTNCKSGDTSFAITSDLAILLRPAQLASLLDPVLAAQPSQSTMFSAGDVAGAAVGAGIPFLIATIVLAVLLAKEKRKHKKQPMPPSEKEAMISSPVPPYAQVHTNNHINKKDDYPIPASPIPRAASPSMASSTVGRSRTSSLLSPSSGGFPSSFLHRYMSMRQSAQSQESHERPERHELDSTPTTIQRSEMGEHRRSG